MVRRWFTLSIRMGSTVSTKLTNWHKSRRAPFSSMSSDAKALVSAKEFYRRPMPRTCVPFGSAEGKQLFREALEMGHMEAYFALAGQLCTQDEPAFCGLTTLVMVLNAFEMDPGLVWKGPWRWYHESMLKCCLPPAVLTEGIVMDKFAELARCHGLNVDMHRMQPSTDNLADFRDLVSRMTQSDRDGLLCICYHRGSVDQTGTGHFAPIGGFHSERDLVFLFDTARFKYPSHWAPLAQLWQGMQQVDPVTNKTRGYFILRRSSANGSRSKLLTEDEQQLDLRDGDAVVTPTSPRVFAISDGAIQAYLSPAALCVKTSIGYRLRQVSDAWANWLMSKHNTQSGSRPHGGDLIREAVQFLIDSCTRHAPRKFIIAVQPFNNNNNDSAIPLKMRMDQEEEEEEESSTLKISPRSIQHDILHDLLHCSVGKTVTAVASSLSPDLFTWFTQDGTFQLIVGRENQSDWTADSTTCPFTELADPKLRLTILLTGFLCAYPYQQLTALRLPEIGSTNRRRGQVMHQLINTELLPRLSKPTRGELAVLQDSLWSLVISGLRPDEALGICCSAHKR